MIQLALSYSTTLSTFYHARLKEEPQLLTHLQSYRNKPKGILKNSFPFYYHALLIFRTNAVASSTKYFLGNGAKIFFHILKFCNDSLQMIVCKRSTKRALILLLYTRCQWCMLQALVGQTQHSARTALNLCKVLTASLKNSVSIFLTNPILPGS